MPQNFSIVRGPLSGAPRVNSTCVCRCRNYACGVKKPWKHSSARERRRWKVLLTNLWHSKRWFVVFHFVANEIQDAEARDFMICCFSLCGQWNSRCWSMWLCSSCLLTWGTIKRTIAWWRHDKNDQGKGKTDNTEIPKVNPFPALEILLLMQFLPKAVLQTG